MNERVLYLYTRALLLLLVPGMLSACGRTGSTATIAPTRPDTSETTATCEPSQQAAITAIPTPATEQASSSGQQEAPVEFVLLATYRDEDAGEAYDDTVTRLVFAPDGQSVASGHADGTVRLWDIATGTMLRSFQAGEEDVRAIEFTPDSRCLLTVGVFGWGLSGSNTVHLWDVASGQQLEGIQSRLAAENIAVSPDGTTVAVATWNTGQPGNAGKVSLYDLASGEHVRDLGPLSHPALALAYSPDGNSIAASAWLYAHEVSDSQILVWDPATGESRSVVEGHTDWVGDLAYAGDGQTLVSISFDDSIRLWDASSAEQQHVFTPPAGQHWAGLANSQSNQLIAALTDEGTVLIWDAKTGEVVVTFQESSDVSMPPDGPALANSLRRLALSPDGSLLATGTTEGVVHLWGLPGALATMGSAGDQIEASPEDIGSQSGVSALVPIATLAFDSHYLSDLAVSPDGQVLACNCYDSVRLWDISAGQELVTLEADPGRSSGGLAFSPDHLRLASAQYSGDVILWELAVQDAKAAVSSELRLEAQESSPDGVIAFGPEGRLLVYSGPGGLVEWDPATGDQEAVMNDLWQVEAIMYFADGHGMVVASGFDEAILIDAGSGNYASLSQDLDTGEFAIIDLETGEEPERLDFPYVISPGTSEIAVLDIETGEEVARIELRSRLNSLAFSPDGSRIALATTDGMIELWDLEDQLKMATLPAGVQAISSVVFSADGRLLASGDVVGVIRLWDLASGTKLVELQVTVDEEESEGGIRSLLFTPDGETLIAGGERIWLWNVASLAGY